jgi:nicotinate-nucleotide adenylyltransferase
MTTNPARVGIFGGTFNPVHLGHLRAAEEVLEALDLERMIFIPSATPPHKADHPDDPIAPAERRLEWLKLAIRDNSRFAVDPLEIERGGASYSVETLRTIAPDLAPEKPVFTIGQDAFIEIDSWREPEALFELAHFAIITRPPINRSRLKDCLPHCIRNTVELDDDGLSAVHRSANTWIRLVEIPALDISSSAIRSRLRNGQSLRYLLPPVVAEAIEKSSVYHNVVGERVEHQQ